MAPACDITRVFSHLYSELGEQRVYPKARAGHHQLTHDEAGDQPQVFAILQRIMTDLADFLDDGATRARGRRDAARPHARPLHERLLLRAQCTARRLPHHARRRGCSGLRRGVHPASARGENASKVSYSILQMMGVRGGVRVGNGASPRPWGSPYEPRARRSPSGSSAAAATSTACRGLLVAHLRASRRTRARSSSRASASCAPTPCARASPTASDSPTTPPPPAGGTRQAARTSPRPTGRAASTTSSQLIPAVDAMTAGVPRRRHPGRGQQRPALVASPSRAPRQPLRRPRRHRRARLRGRRPLVGSDMFLSTRARPST